VRRAGLDYHELTNVQHHESWAACREVLAQSRLFAVDNPGATRYDQARYREGDAFVFGKETSGLPAEMLAGFAPKQRIELPMRPDNRSLNLSNAVAVVVFEAWRQCGFAGSSSNP